MSKDILVRMRIPVVPKPEVMLFWAWLPTEEDDSLIVREDGLSLALRFDLDCLKGPLRLKTAGHLSDPRQSWVWAEKVIADVTVEGVSDELAEFVMVHGSRRDSDETSVTDKDEALAREYEGLGERVYSFSLTNYNRLVAFARTEMGNHRLEEHPVDPSTMAAVFKRFGAEATVEGSEWVEWTPTETSSLTIDFPFASQHMDEEDWGRAGQFVRSGEQTSLVKELLAGAHTLAAKQHRRNALTEAVTALEAAVYGFVGSLRDDEASRSKLAENVPSAKVRKRLREVGPSRTAHDIGLSKTVRHLIPAALTEEQMPRRLLDSCLEAVSQRHAVVHRGQRYVGERELDPFLASTTEMCLLLEHRKTS